MRLDTEMKILLWTLAPLLLISATILIGEASL